MVTRFPTQEALQQFINSDQDPNQLIDAYTPLRIAIEHNRLDFVKILLDRDANINELSDGYTPLHYTVGKSLSITELLLQYGANVNGLDKHGETPLFLAIESDQSEYVDLLLKYKVDLNVQSKETGNTCLHNAVQNNSFDIVALLLSHGSDYTLKNHDGCTAKGVALSTMDCIFQAPDSYIRFFESNHSSYRGV